MCSLVAAVQHVPRQQAGSQAGGAEAGVQVARSACHGQDKRGHDWPVATYRWRDRIGQQEPFGQGRIGGVAYDFFFFFFFFPTSAVRLCPCSQRAAAVTG